MDRRLLFPVIAATAWAQASPEAAEAEKALRARVEQFYQLETDKKFRQAEALVAEDSKDFFYNGGRPDIRSFRIEKIELTDGNTKAQVTLKVGTSFVFPGLGTQSIEAPAQSLWKIEEGQWVWYVDPTAAIQTPFGTFHPGAGPSQSVVSENKIPTAATLMSQVTVDRTSITLSAAQPTQTATVSNSLPGAIDVKVDSPPIDGLTVTIDKSHVEAGGQTSVQFALKKGSRPSGTVRLVAAPLGQELNIQVSTN